MDVRVAIPEEEITAPVLNAGLEAVTRLNEQLITSGKAPTFAEGVRRGVRWAPEPPGLESFDHARKVAARGWGDCDDLAPWHASSLRVSGADPRARAVVYQSGPHRWHAIVRRGDGRYEDPSQTAGMRVPRGSRAEGIPAAVVGCMAHPGACVSGPVRPHVAVRRGHGGTWLARADVPMVSEYSEVEMQVPYITTIHGHLSSPARALSGAVRGACIIGLCAGAATDEQLDKLYALSGLLRGESPAQVAEQVDRETVKDAIRTLAQIAPEILSELQAHRRATERSRAAGHPFARSYNFGRLYDQAVTGCKTSERAWRAQRMTPEVGSSFSKLAAFETLVSGSRNMGMTGNPRAAAWHASVGFDLFQPSSYHEVLDNPGKVVSDVAKGAGQAAHVVQPILDAAKQVASVAQGVISLVPGIGSGISAAISAGLAILEGGGAVDIAIKTAYGAIPIPPGIRTFTDMVLDAVLSLVHSKSVGAAALALARKQLVGKVPGFAQGLVGQVFDTLAHVVFHGSSSKPTRAVTTKPVAVASNVHRALQVAHASGAKLPPHVTPIPATHKANLAVAVAIAQKVAAKPKSLADAVRLLRPTVVRHRVIAPKGL